MPECNVMDCEKRQVAGSHYCFAHGRGREPGSEAARPLDHDTQLTKLVALTAALRHTTAARESWCRYVCTTERCYCGETLTVPVEDWYAQHVKCATKDGLRPAEATPCGCVCWRCINGDPSECAKCHYGHELRERKTVQKDPAPASATPRDEELRATAQLAVEAHDACEQSREGTTRGQRAERNALRSYRMTELHKALQRRASANPLIEHMKNMSADEQRVMDELVEMDVAGAEAVALRTSNAKPETDWHASYQSACDKITELEAALHERSAPKASAEKRERLLPGEASHREIISGIVEERTNDASSKRWEGVIDDLVEYVEAVSFEVGAAVHTREVGMRRNDAQPDPVMVKRALAAEIPLARLRTTVLAALASDDLNAWRKTLTAAFEWVPSESVVFQCGSCGTAMRPEDSRTFAIEPGRPDALTEEQLTAMREECRALGRYQGIHAMRAILIDDMPDDEHAGESWSDWPKKLTETQRMRCRDEMLAADVTGLSRERDRTSGGSLPSDSHHAPVRGPEEGPAPTPDAPNASQDDPRVQCLACGAEREPHWREDMREANCPLCGELVTPVGASASPRPSQADTFTQADLDNERAKFFEKARVYGAIAYRYGQALSKIAGGIGVTASHVAAREALAWRHSGEFRGVPKADLDAFEALLVPTAPSSSADTPSEQEEAYMALDCSLQEDRRLAAMSAVVEAARHWRKAWNAESGQSLAEQGLCAALDGLKEAGL